jgi:ketosteroid isomerase-like protein
MMKKEYLFCLAFLCFIILGACAAESDDSAASVFQRYEEAFNRHDSDAVASFWALNVDAGKLKEIQKRWKGDREFEAATNAVFEISWKAVGPDAYEVTQKEDCDFYRELGTGTKISTFTIHLKGGKFHDVQRGTSIDTLGDYDQTKQEFISWVQKNEPELAVNILLAGDIEFNKETAPIIMDLVRKWRASKT